MLSKVSCLLVLTTAALNAQTIQQEIADCVRHSEFTEETPRKVESLHLG